jgi:signal transduction histidine kinase
MVRAMSLSEAWIDARQSFARWWRLADAPPPDEAVFLRRVRFVERGVMLPVKAVMLLLLLYFLFYAHWFVNPTSTREDALNGLRNFFLIYLCLNVGTGIMVWGMDEISPRVLERAVYSTAILDGAVVAALTLVTGGFDSILYYAFFGLIIRNAAIIAHAEVQIVVNLTVSACYVVAGWLDVALEQLELEVVRSVGRGEIGGEGGELPSIHAEPLLLRVLILLLLTACCYGIQMLGDRQRLKEEEAREFALKQQQLEAAGRIAAEIAHQLKNPLGIINNAAYTLHKSVREGKTITQQIAIIREEVEKSDRIITELMGYAKLAEGKVERVRITDELERAISQTLPEAAKFDIRIHRDYALGLPLLLGQSGHFSEVFVNLLTNAREAMNGRGEIFLTAKAEPDLSVLVSIRDTGPGIPQDLLVNLFEPYFTTKEKGTGLGLAIVKHNTELYGGSVSVESEPGQGTTFHVRLPARSLMRLRK